MTENEQTEETDETPQPTVKKKVSKKKVSKKAVKKEPLETDLIECVVIRGIAAGKPGDVVNIERIHARKLQDVGAVKVKI